MILVVGAASLMVMMCGTQRPSEFLSLPSGRDPATGRPLSISCEDSDSGNFKIFRLQSKVYKRMAEPMPASWIVGCKTADDPSDPIAVMAIEVLQAVFDPFRAKASSEGEDMLMISPGHGVRAAGDGPIGPMTADTLRRWQRIFIAESVDWGALPDVARDGTDLRPFKSTRGGRIRPTHWRKTLVQFMFRLDDRMALPLARHLKHFSRQFAQKAYLSHDPALLEEVDDAMARTLARTLVAMATGDESSAGWLHDLMFRHIGEIEAVMGDLTGEPAVAKVHAWAKERQLGLFMASPGKCGLRLTPLHALCHLVAGTAEWHQRFPSPARTDEHCAGCRSCIVDGDHLHYWTSRYTATRRQVLVSRRLGREGESRVHATQSAAAARTLTRLGARIPPDEELT